MSAALIAGSVAIGLGGGVASAVETQGVVGTGATLFPGGQPNNIRQNTRGAEKLTAGIPDAVQAAGFPTGAAQALQLTVGDNWRAGDAITFTVAPNSTGPSQPGLQCETPQQVKGVNQSTRNDSNWVGFPTYTPGATGNGVAPPSVVSTFGGGSAPTFTFSQAQFIDCSNDGGQPGAYTTMIMTFSNTGPAAGSTVTLNIGTSAQQAPAPAYNGPIILSVGFGATTGPVQVWGAYDPVIPGLATTPFLVSSFANVVGQTPSANSPRNTLVRNTASDKVAGPISDFKITEGPSNSLPPTDGTAAANPMGPNTFDSATHQIRASASGFVCLSIDERPGFDLKFNQTAAGPVGPGWSVTPSAGSAGNSAAAGDAKVVNDARTVVLPVTSSSNSLTGAVWSTSGLTLSGTALTDGPVWAYAYWVDGDYNGDTVDCPKASQAQATGEDIYILGYVQLTTISEQANAIFGNNAEATAAQAVNHQFDYVKGDCVSNTVGDSFIYGPSIFLARSDNFTDGLGAAYSAGTVESGVLLTPPKSLDARTKDTIRLQGVQTVFVAGGPLAISDDVVNQLKDTISYQCRGVAPRLDPNTGLPKKLVVIRIYGETAWDTNARLAEFVGAEPPAAFGPFGANSPGQPFNTAGGISQWGTPPSGWVNTALLVTGDNFQDAMVASVPAYGGSRITDIGTGGPMPLIATSSAGLTQQAIDAMFNQHIQQLIVVGGPLAVPDSVVNQAIAAIPGLSAFRIAGMNASETSVNLAMFELAKATVNTTTDLRQWGMGWKNFDPNWENYVNRTAGNINFNTNEGVGAHVVLMTRGDYFADAMSAAAVLSVHNGRYNRCRNQLGNPGNGEMTPVDNGDYTCTKFPLIITESPTSLGADVTNFLTKGSLAVSTLTGALNSGGYTSSNGNNYNNESSSVFTIQPIGGPLALSPTILTQAAKLIGS